jgi:hypothetical protein
MFRSARAPLNPFLPQTILAVLTQAWAPPRPELRFCLERTASEVTSANSAFDVANRNSITDHLHFESICDELFGNRMVGVDTAGDDNSIGTHSMSIFTDAIGNIALRDRHEFCTGDELDTMIASLVNGTSPAGVGHFETKFLARFKDSDAAASFGKVFGKFNADEPATNYDNALADGHPPL